MNKIILCGRLGKDPQLLNTQTGISVCKFSLATSEKRNDQEYVEWHNITCFGKQADAAAKYLEKGRELLVEGKMTYSTYEKQDGSTGYSSDVICNSFQFIGSGQNRDTTPRNEYAETQTNDDNPALDEIPF